MKDYWSKPTLDRNSGTQEWQWVYLEQQAADPSEKYKKHTGNK